MIAPQPPGQPPEQAPFAPHAPEAQLAAARRAARLAQLLAAAALVVAVIAVVVSLAALANRRADTAPAAAPGTSSQRPEPTTSRSAPTSIGSPGATSTAAENVRPEADFRLKFERQRLTVVPPESCSDEPRHVDVDEPRVGAVLSSAEFSYGAACGGGRPEIDITDGLPISSADDDAVARDCAEAIRNGPINEPLVPTDETNLCLLTSAERAAAEGTTRKIILISVENIAPDGTMAVLLTAWDVPT